MRALPRKSPAGGFRVVIALVLAAGSVSQVVSPLLAAKQRSQSPSAAGATTAILVDVVVRDKNGEPVADLKPQDFEIIEDGVDRNLGSFTPIFRDATREATRTTIPTTPTTPTVAAPSEQAAAAHKDAAAQAGAAANTPGEVLALVFDRLTPDNRPPRKGPRSVSCTEVPEGQRLPSTASISAWSRIRP